MLQALCVQDDSLNNQVWEELNTIRLDAFSKLCHKNLQQKYVALLMTRVSELCQDSLLLLGNRRAASAPIVLRSALESYVDLICVISDINYIDEMNKSFDLYRRKVQGEKTDKKKELMNIFERFKKAGEENIYNGLYAHLCRSSHGNLEMLIHFHSVEEKISVGHEPNYEQIEIIENQTLALAATSLIVGLRFFGEFEEQIIRLEMIQQDAGNRKFA